MGSADHFVRAFLQGEGSVVARVEGIVSRVVRFRGYFVPAEDRRDLVQEVLLQACDALSKPGFVFTRGFTPFLRSLAHRRCVDWMRQHRHLTEIDPALPSTEPAPDEILLKSEERDLAMRILEELPDSCRELIRLHREANLTYREIARRTGRSEGALRNDMCECLKKARQTLLHRQSARASDVLPPPRRP